MDYSSGIRFKKSIVNMDEAEALTTRNQPEKSNHKQQKRGRCESTKHLQVTSNDCPFGLENRKAKLLALGMGLSQYKAEKAVEYEAGEEEGKCLTAEASGEV